MTAGGYDEWAAARVPSLLRFAHLVVDDHHRCEDVVRHALTRVHAHWESVARRDDPDLVARRYVVDACRSRRSATARAALVLRHLEDRTDAEIADVLRCSEAAARSHAHRGASMVPMLVAAGASSPRDPIRTALEERAATAPIHVVPPAGAPGRPGTRRVTHWVAALAVLALVGGVAYIAGASRSPSGVIVYPPVRVPPDWRYESYNGVEVEVPPTWGWGGAPVPGDQFRGGLGACGTSQAAVKSPYDGESYISSLTPFVGRPAVVSDACMSFGSDGVMPGTDAVWFGSPLAVGVKNVGFVTAETRSVDGQRVTVFSHDSDLRRKILGTARAVAIDGNGCPTRAVLRPSAGPRAIDPVSLSVCVYSQDTGVPALLYSERLPQSYALAYQAVIAKTGPAGDGHCAPTPRGVWVALGLADTRQRGTRWDVVDLDCARILRARPRGSALVQSRLTGTTVAPWLAGGLPAYVDILGR